MSGKYDGRSLRTILKKEIQMANIRNAEDPAIPSAEDSPTVKTLRLLIEARALSRKPIMREFPNVKVTLKQIETHLSEYLSNTTLKGGAA